MLHKWKIILGNWINCYFEKDSEKEFPVTLDSLVNIISHLRENFNLDESKSALLDAHTIQEFLLEKYPSFRFENGTVEPINEEEIYMAASLLLFFVCINSKDVDIKSAMCNKLSGSDQKTILKFTKCLMECSNISSLDVLTAIAEACGQDVAASEIETFKVAETPPALRSLHSEVRRLQAALDAERFDRNYLQEELARTNLKMEKLLKDKEQYKQDIVNLKAKISCCGQEDESKAETSSTNSVKLSKQLEETEERLVSVQERLDDVQYERDMYKNKLDELKHERDKWFTISQQESDRVAQLVEELETERHHVHSLKELVTELRQHNRLNGLDSSQLECDDLDASVQSLPHNTSVCSEACANVIEVQLSEERAKIVLLKQQMQMLQDQLHDLTKKSEEEHRNLTHIISEKDTDIFNLKHRINEEIEDKNALKVHYDNEVTKLNNEVNELEQRLRDTGENSRRIIDSKMNEIQTLQEEKMSLLQSLSDEITKFDNIIKDLKADIDSEKSSKLKMREEYEKQMMKLKEKVSNRNNELVELQNKIFEKGEMIEILQCDLRKEKEISNKYNNDVKHLTSQIQAYENNLRQKSEEVSELQKQIQQYTLYNEQLNMDLQHVKSCLAKSNEDCKVLEEHNSKLKVELQNRDVKIEKIQKDIEAQEIINIEEKKKLQYNLDEINATVDALKIQLQNEIEYKIQIQNELEEVKIANNKLTEDISQSNSKLNKIMATNKDLEKLLTEEKESSENLKQKCAELNNTVEQLKINVIEKDSIITLTKKDLDETKIHFDEQSVKMNELIDSFKIKLKLERSENNDMKQKLDCVEKEKMDLAVAIREKDNVGSEMLMEIKTLTHKAKENEIIIKNLEDNLSEKTKTLENVRIDFDVETNKLRTKINDMDKTLKELQLTTNNTIQSKDLEIDKLKLDIEKLQSTLQTEEEKIMHVDNERTNLIQQLEEVNVYKCKMEKEYLNKCAELNDEIAHTKEKIDKLESELENVLEDNKAKIEEIKTLKLNIEQACENSKELCDKKDSETNKLMTKINDMDKTLKELQLTSNNTIQSKDLEIDKLKLDIEKLQSTLQTEEEKIRDVDNERTNLIQQLEEVNVYKCKMEKEYFNKCALLNTLNNELNDEIAHKKEKIDKLESELENVLEDNKTKIEEIKTLKLNIEQACENSKELCDKKDSDIKDLCLKIENLEALLATSQEELKVVVDNNDQLIKSLQKENIQLHHTIEKDNSTYKLLIKEKEKVIETLEIELKHKANILNQLQNGFEQEKLTWKQLKLDTEEQISIKNEQIKELTEKALNNQAQLEEKEVILKAMDAQVNSLREEKIRLNNEIDSLRNTYNESAHSNDVLKDNLNKEKVEKENLEIKTQYLTQENQALSQKIDQIEDSYKKVIYERDSLLNEKAILVQQLMDEKSILKIADEGKEALLLEKIKVEEQLKELQETINTLVQEKECLTQQLVDERLSKELAEKEIESLTLVKVELEDKLNEEKITRAQLIGKIESLSKEIENITKDKEHKNISNTELQKDVCNLKQKINILEEENKHLTIETESFKNNLLEYEKNQEQLIQEKTALVNEKESLTNCLDKLRLDYEKLKSENMALEEKVQEIRNTWSSEVNSKQEQIKQMSIDLNTLKSDYKTLEEDSSKIVTILTCGLNKVIDNIKRDEVCSKILEKYESVVKENTLENCDIIFKIISDLSSELNLKKNLEKALEDEDLVIKELSEKVKQKETQISKLEIEAQNLKKVIDDSKTESIKQKETYTSLLETKTQDIQQLKIENDSLNHELNDLKQQLDVKVHSLKDKLEDNENLTEKLKKTYDCQIDNLNMMVSKLTNYLKEKSMELESVRNEKEKLQCVMEENNKVLKSLEEELKVKKQNQEKLITDFESERQVLNNMVSVTESMMEDQKVNLNRIISEHVKTNETLENEVKILKDALENEKTNFDIKSKEKEDIFNYNIEKLNMELMDLHKENDTIKKDFVLQNEVLKNKIIELEDNIVEKDKCIETITNENKMLNEKTTAYEIKTKEYEQNIILLEEKNNEIISNNAANEVKIVNKMQQLKNELEKLVECSNKLNTEIENKSKENGALYEKIWKLEDQILNLEKAKRDVEAEKVEYLNKIYELNTNLEKFVKENKVLEDIKNENLQLLKMVDEKDSDIAKLEKRLELELDRQKQINERERINLVNKCAILEEYQQKAEMELESRQKEIGNLQEEIKTLTLKTQESINEKDRLIVQVKEEKDAMINALNEQLNKKKQDVENIKIILELKQAEVLNLKNELDQKNQEDNIVQILRKENEELIKVIGQRETFAATSQERSGPKYSGQVEKERDHQQQVVSTSSDTHSSMESYKTITDLEKIVQDKNRTITTLQSDITYLKSIIAESENNLLDVSKELELSKENCQQLSSQLKKIVHQKNEEIAELRKQVAKMSVTENRASQIIKVSAKYQAIILKRIAEIKSNTVLKELTNFGNSNCDNDIRRSITAGTITMEDLENFLETTERHIRRCSDKQIALQKERDRLAEINRISESEIINMRKFLTELSVSMKTFNSVKDLYTQRLSRVISIQRTVRREILSLDGRVNDATMCKLERGYAAVIQDLAECTMNLERWIERCVSRAISPEKIKQAFTSDADRVSLASGTFQNTSLEVQIEELQKSFEKLLEDVSRAQKGEGAKDTQSITVMEVRAEYEDKLNRMKAKMKQLYQEQIAVFRENQKKELAGLEMELQKTQDKLKEYEDHIKSLTAELWKVGEKFLVKKDEADWLKKKQKSGSLMSLQHVHSSGLVPPLEEPSRPSDASSLRSLPVTNQREDKTGRTLQMSDEEGEVFDNRWLRELATPSRPARLCELRWRNSLCPPHLKSSYPAETQFAPALQEEDIKCTGAMSLGGKSQRKEVGITAYKKPGPPTPSKQAGRLSATDSELRESLRVETEPGARKTSTPSRIRSLFRSNKNDTTEGTPRSRRLSNMFRKK